MFGHRTSEYEECHLGLGEYVHTVEATFDNYKHYSAKVVVGMSLITNRKICGYYGIGQTSGTLVSFVGKRLLYVEGRVGDVIDKLKIHFES